MNPKSIPVVEWRQRTKRRMIEAFGGKCAICGIESYPEIYDFHHLDPSQKEFAVGRLAIRAWHKLVPELRKCILLCSNCHRKLHYGRVSLPEKLTRFNEQYTNYSIITKDGRSLQMNDEQKLVSDSYQQNSPCLICGTSKTINQKYCSIKCANQAHRKVSRPSKEELYKLITEVPMTHIGKMFGVSSNSVRKWIKYYNAGV